MRQPFPGLFLWRDRHGTTYLVDHTGTCEGGRITAAVSSQISDGAAAPLVASEPAVRTHGLTPLAGVHAISVVGSDPGMAGDGGSVRRGWSRVTPSLNADC